MKAITLFVVAGSCFALAMAGCGEDDPVDGGPDGGGSSSSSGGVASSSSSSSSGSTSSSSSSSGDGGGSSSSSGDGGSGGEWTATCDAQATRSLECNPESTLEAEKLDCTEESACYDNLRPGAAQQLSECLIARECGTSDDECFLETGEALGGQPVADFETACLGKLSECEEESEGFFDDYCGGAIGIFPESVLSASTTCLAGACETINDCMNAAIETVCPSED